MRRSIATVAAVVTAALGTGTALAAAEDQATGSGQFPNSTHFGFSAHGELADARGNAFFEIGPAGKIHADVSCLNVDGERAALAGTLKEPAFGTDRYVLLIQDGGSPSKKNPTPDRGYFILNYGPQNADCGLGNFNNVPNGTPIVQGNFNIRDR